MAQKKFRGSNCTQDCGGHKAGFAYGNSGKSKLSPYSPSFNQGVMMGQQAASTRTKRKKKK